MTYEPHSLLPVDSDNFLKPVNDKYRMDMFGAYDHHAEGASAFRTKYRTTFSFNRQVSFFPSGLLFTFPFLHSSRHHSQVYNVVHSPRPLHATALPVAGTGVHTLGGSLQSAVNTGGTASCNKAFGLLLDDVPPPEAHCDIFGAFPVLCCNFITS